MEPFIYNEMYTTSNNSNMPMISQQNQQLYNNQTLNGNLFSHQLGQNIIYNPNVLDLTSKENSLKEQINVLTTAKEQLDFINSIHDVTKEILKVIIDVQASGKLEDIKKLDIFVRQKMFNTKFDDFINEEK